MKDIGRRLAYMVIILFVASYGISLDAGLASSNPLLRATNDRNSATASAAIPNLISRTGETGAKGIAHIGTDANFADRDRRTLENVPARKMLAQAKNQEKSGARALAESRSTEKVWKSQELGLLGIGLGVGDLDGDGKSEVVIVDPSTVHAYRFIGGKLSHLAEYSAGSMEIKAVDVARMRKQGPCRIYVTAQNRGSLSSFVLEYRNGRLIPVMEGLDYFLRVILYPTQGAILLGQKKGLVKMYEGPVYRLADKGDALEPLGRFGIPLKIPIFGFAIGDFNGNYKPLIAVYDRSDHLRIYQPTGKRLYISREFYGGSDVILRRSGMDSRTAREADLLYGENEMEYMRPRIMSLNLDKGSRYEILAISHSSKTGRLLGRTKMLEDGRVNGLLWNGDALVRKWRTPRIQGMITDFTVDTLPGLSGRRLIVLERLKTDWLSFLRSQSLVRAYDIESLIHGATGKESETDDE